MIKITREHYPVSQLPEDLRAGFEPSSTVIVMVEEEEQRPEHGMTLEEIFSSTGFRRRSNEEIDAEIRRQRDERDD